MVCYDDQSYALFSLIYGIFLLFLPFIVLAIVKIKDKLCNIFNKEKLNEHRKKH